MTVLVGHRGACGHAPENTLASLRIARRFGLEWVEFDVRVTADGVPVLLHDDTLDRTTDATGPVSEWSLQALEGVDAGRWFGEAFGNQRIPTLEDAVRFLTAAGMRANVEIKASPGQERNTAAATLNVLKRVWPAELGSPLLSSFAPSCLAVAREQAPDWPRALLFEKVPSNWRERLHLLGCRALHCHYRSASGNLAGSVREAGLALRVYTVNDADTASALVAKGVDAIVTDFPDRIRAAVEGRFRVERSAVIG